MEDGWDVDLLDELEYDILFINDVTRAIAPAILEGSRRSGDARTLTSILKRFVHSNNLRLCKGPEGVTITDEAAFLNILEASIIAGNYDQVSYSYWIDKK